MTTRHYTNEPEYRRSTRRALPVDRRSSPKSQQALTSPACTTGRLSHDMHQLPTARTNRATHAPLQQHGIQAQQDQSPHKGASHGNFPPVLTTRPSQHKGRREPSPNNRTNATQTLTSFTKRTSHAHNNTRRSQHKTSKPSRTTLTRDEAPVQP